MSPIFLGYVEQVEPDYFIYKTPDGLKEFYGTNELELRGYLIAEYLKNQSNTTAPHAKR